MKLSLLAILILSLAKPAAFASEEVEEGPDPAEVEKFYQSICVADAGAQATTEERDQRAKLLAFLDRPEETVRQITEVMENGNAMEQFFGSISFGMTCGVVGLIKDKVEAGGCRGEDGREHSVARAVAACTEAAETLQKASE